MRFDENNTKNFQIMEFNTMDLDILPSLSFLCQCIIIVFDKTKYQTFSKIKKIISNLKIKYSDYENECNNIILVSTFNDIEKSEIEENEINDILNNIVSRTSSLSSNIEIKNNNINIPIQYISISNITKNNILKLKTLILNTYKTKIYLSPPLLSLSNNEEKKEINNIERNIINPKEIIKPIKDKKEETYNDFKIILLGDTTVGKTAFFRRFFLNEFTSSFTSTFGINELSKYILIEDKKFKIQIWDTAGQERFKSIPQKYYEKADGIILIYDITNEESFNNINRWIKDIRKNSSENIIIYLLGNKVDLINERKIKVEQGRKIAFEQKMKFCEISCKWDLNVSDVVYCLVYDMYLVTKENERKNLELQYDSNHSKSCCF